MLADRFCIATNGDINVVLSPEDMVTCDLSDAGCNGGYISNAVNRLITEGVVSESCLPYVSGSIGSARAPSCSYKCSDSSVPYQKYACKFGSSIFATSPEAIQTELKAHGPMAVGFNVYSDFSSYSSGIYERTSDVFEGGHAVKLVGWAYNSGRLYWICQNQWGAWGISNTGFFYIYADQCGIDAVAWACMPDIK